MFKLIPHTEFQGGQLAQPFLLEKEFEVGESSEDRKGEKYIAYNKIPFKSYEFHKIDKKKKLPLNKDKLNEESVVLSFLELRQAEAHYSPVSDYPMRYVGNHITDYYNEHIRNDTMNNVGKSLNSLWNNLESRKKLYEDAYALKRQNMYLRGDYDHKTAEKDIFSKLTDQDLKGALQNSVFSNNQFKPFTAKVVYDYFNKKTGITRILDFSAGWGGRMVGAMSLDLNYTGIDPNVNLASSYKNILETLKPYNSSKVEMIFNYAENIDFSKIDYDFVLTSPPYIAPDGKQTEKYKNMKDYTMDSFYTEFLIPTIYRIMLNLPNGKYFCINTNINNFEVLKNNLLGVENEKIPYKTKERAGGKKRRQVEGARDRYTEFVYCYKKSKGLLLEMEQRMRLNKISVSKKPNNVKNLRDSIKVNGDSIKTDKEVRREIRTLRGNRRQNTNDLEYKGGVLRPYLNHSFL